MKHDAAVIVLRPRRLPELFDLGCRLCASLALPLYARLAALLLLPLWAASLWLRYGAGWPWAEVWLAIFVTGCVAQGAFTVALGRLLFSGSVRVGAVLSRFASRLPAYVLSLLLCALLYGLAALPFLVALPFASVWLLLVHEICLLEGAGPMRVTGRAARTLTGRGLSAFALRLLLLFAHAAMVLGAELLGQSLIEDVLQLGRPFGSLWRDGGSPFALLGFLLGLPLVATVRLLFYTDTRTRADGWDIQVRFQKIAASAPAARSAAP